MTHDTIGGMNRDRAWHAESVSYVFAHFNTTPHGLSVTDAIGHLKTYGKNVLDAQRTISFATRFFVQLKNPLALVLLAAATVTLFLAEYLDAVVVLAALCVNIGIGLF